ncbi:ATP-binding cassette domain-containing protein [Cytobacillus oceanisediminis]|uniref:ATP-binding cassette domain-containing protein n=2 Tax=Niallia TaxID=2837506 RepID=A0A941GSM9_NIACI|nr:ATP-binding cassette domain-containing protein [Niallia circulans]MBQ6449167.1 ATP-binding cassette domain-containing protein [Bacillus sp. (in: firmicutes)]MBZ9533560.1 ATP-binding cassette domain-containing protein [Cytobacillus oceanisediminis]NMO77048.1 ATP-binding cassette domain-containing protein [Niallia alba]UTI40272.1 ATP-binding cassette domain-containing protein [Niallia sp. RD1]MCB5239992.1 ATP-binding cassette domain-containing protein [Niallia circulans]
MLLYSSFEKEGEALIKVDGINKSFKVAKRATGLVEGLKALVSREHTIVHALNDVSFTINPGEIVGYIGPNGAGKSTTIKVMSGILVPDSGSCEIMGYTPWKDRVEYVKNIGVVFGQRSQLWWDVPVIDSFALLKDIYHIPDKEYDETLSLLIDTLELKDILHSPVRQLSLGQRMRCEIAASLIHNPQILFLDEPTIGLDAVSKIAVRNFIKKINKQKNVTVILTTHDMFDIEALCDRVILIGKGSLLYDGNLQELRNRFGSHRTITVDYKSSNIPIQIPGTINLSRTEERAILSVDTTQISVSEVIMELSHSLDLVDISVMSQPIEDIIVQLYKEYEI